MLKTLRKIKAVRKAYRGFEFHPLHEVHPAVFDWVLARIAEAGLINGERIGVDASTMEANAALRSP